MLGNKRMCMFLALGSIASIYADNNNNISKSKYERLYNNITKNMGSKTADENYRLLEKILNKRNKELNDLYMQSDYIVKPEGNLFLYPEIDTYWAKVGGADPFEYMKKFSGRIPMIHFKDMKSDLSLSYPESLAEIGTGCIDFLPFLKWGEKNGIESYIVEQDVSALSGGMLESMAVSLENLIKLSEQL